jgi:hypothetical protein
MLNMGPRGLCFPHLTAVPLFGLFFPGLTKLPSVYLHVELTFVKLFGCWVGLPSTSCFAIIWFSILRGLIGAILTPPPIRPLL